VLDAVSASMDATAGTGMPLAERMILALEAATQKAATPLGNLQSAAIKIADPEQSRTRQRSHRARDRGGETLIRSRR
jgi:uncharacterized Ntn-hydrolase superfamily protein